MSAIKINGSVGEPIFFLISDAVTVVVMENGARNIGSEQLARLKRFKMETPRTFEETSSTSGLAKNWIWEMHD